MTRVPFGVAIRVCWVAMLLACSLGGVTGVAWAAEPMDGAGVAGPARVALPVLPEAAAVPGVERAADRVFDLDAVARIQRQDEQRLLEVSLDAGAVVRELPLPGKGGRWSAEFLAVDAAAGVLVGRFVRAVPAAGEDDAAEQAQPDNGPLVIRRREPRPRQEARVVWDLADGGFALLRQRDLPPPRPDHFLRRAVRWHYERGTGHIWQVEFNEQGWVLSRLLLDTLEPTEVWRHPTLKLPAEPTEKRPPLWSINSERQRLYLLSQETEGERRLVPWLTVVDLATGEQVRRWRLHDQYVSYKLLDGPNERLALRLAPDWLRAQLQDEDEVNHVRVLDLTEAGEPVLNIAMAAGRHIRGIRPRDDWRYIFLTDSASHRRIIWRLDTETLTWSWPRRVPTSGPVPATWRS